jgi:hypothetical protein
LHGRQTQPDDHPDNCQYNEKLDERKAASLSRAMVEWSG